jgi:hypothetical protein
MVTASSPGSFVPSVRFQVLTAASMKIRAFRDVASCSLGVDCTVSIITAMNECHPDDAVRTSETSINFNETIRCYITKGSNIHFFSGRGMWHAWDRIEKCTRFWWESQRKRPLGRPRRRWENGIRMDLGEIGLGGVWIGFDWLRTGTGGGLLWVRWWTFGFLRHRVSWLVS